MNQLSLLLLVDPDRKGLEALTYGFEREGCAVAGTIDPTLAPELARTTTPQLAVISLHQPDRQVLDLITGLRGQESTRDLPVVTLGPAAMRPAAMAAGASDFLSTPLFVRDVISVGKLMLLMRSALAAKADGGEVELSALLSEYHGLYYMIRALSATSRSGILQLNRGNKKGEVRFSEGTVVSALVGPLQGFPALHQLLLWEEAAISLKLRPVAHHRQFAGHPGDLLEECERFMRDFAHAARDLGSPRTTYMPVEGGPAPGAKRVPAEATPVLRLFDGQRTLAEVIEASPFRIFDTLRVIKRLVDAGAVALRPGSLLQDQAAADRMEQWMRTSGPMPSVQEMTPRPTRPSGAHAPTAAAAAQRPSGAHRPLVAAERPTPPQMPTVDEKRAASGGDRRKSSRQRELGAVDPASPASQATPPPIPLTVRKSSSEAVATAATARRTGRTPPPLAALAIGSEPTIQMKLDAAFPPKAVPAQEAAPPAAPESPAVTDGATAATMAPAAPSAEAAAAAAPAPAPPPPPTTAAAPAGKGPDSKTKLKKASHPRLTPTSAFNAIESDFFAREADLYHHDAVESFDDLDRGASARKLQPIPGGRPGGGAKKKR